MSVFDLHATTVVGIIHNGEVAIGSDGQATLDKTVMKSTVKKVKLASCSLPPSHPTKRVTNKRMKY